VIVLEEIYDRFVERLAQCTGGLQIGPAEDPATEVPPVIDAKAQQRIQGIIEDAAQRLKVLVRRDAPKGGHYVGPAIFGEVPPTDRIAQEEIFGPVIAVIRVKDFDEALRVANGTYYALTGGVFSRSPGNLERARREFRVGNLYLNRGITGALVDRQPFGGFAMSGVGSKAGGPDYLLQFMEPRVVTENTMRRGFAADAAGSAGERG
jgi:RHH-type proline utilization regulon transcriptional repressor/proline dehydrogenase/delta 1-pyrroline-5-carboxylate dehydrogenase